MKKVVAPLVAIMFPALASGAEVGLSGAIGSSMELRVPIRMSNIIVEPYIEHYLSKDTDEDDIETKYRNSGVGITIWKLVNLNEVLTAQIGLQAGYRKDVYEGGYVSQTGDGVSGREYTEELDGYMIAPGFGLFYSLNDYLDVGVEVKYRYEKLEGEIESRSAGYPDYAWQTDPGGSLRETNSRVQTQAVVRIFF